jgi:cystathionine beta-lyase family protein involved in aluminum resistance
LTTLLQAVTGKFVRRAGLFLAPGVAGEAWKSAVFLRCALAPTGLLADPQHTEIPSYPATELLLPSEAAGQSLLAAVQSSMPLATGLSSTQAGLLPDGRKGLKLAGGFVPGAFADMQVLLSLSTPHEAVLYGGTHWVQWLNAVSAVWSELKGDTRAIARASI